MDGSGTNGRGEAMDVGSTGDLAGTMRRRTLLAGLAGLTGLLVLPSLSSTPAFADVPAHYGRGYRGGYR